MGLFSRKTEDKKKTADLAEKQATKSMKDLYGASDSDKIKSEVNSQAEKSFSGNAYKVIIKPLVTEKVSGLGALNKYVFAVAKNTNKIEVAKAIKEIYDLKPADVNVIRMSGKKVRYGRISGKRKDWKKAIITLPKGETIKIYEGV